MEKDIGRRTTKRRAEKPVFILDMVFNLKYYTNRVDD